MVYIRIYGVLSKDIGRSHVEVAFGGSTLADLVDQMAGQYGPAVKSELLDEEGNLDFAYGVFKAGDRIMDLKATVEDGAEIVIVNMLGGG